MLTERTMRVLKSFSTINPSIVLKPGNKIKTISNQKTIMAEANIDQTFDKESAIYDLNRFLGTVSLFETPVLEFKDKTINITEGKKKVTYTLTEPSMVVTPPGNAMKMPECEINVNLAWSQIDDVLKAASVLQLPEISFTGRGKDVILETIDPKSPTSDTYGITIGENTTGNDFNFFMKVENIKLIPNDYKVSISSGGLATFYNVEEVDGNVPDPKYVRYWIAIESNSKFGG